MKKNYTYFMFLVSFYTFSQVGIGTTTPQQDLHVAGATSTIRIESLDAVNNPDNDGVGLKPVYVTKDGDFTLTKPGFTSGGTGYVLPINFLVDDKNFVPDNIMGLPAPYDKHGRVINCSGNPNVPSITELIHTVPVTVPAAAMIEVKFGMSVIYSSTDLAAPPYAPTFITDGRTRVYNVFFCVDINSDGLSPAEFNIQYGTIGQYYSSDYGGTNGYTYLNSQAYAELPPGNHTFHFFGTVKDPDWTFSSFGFGGSNDFLKIRVY